MEIVGPFVGQVKKRYKERRMKRVSYIQYNGGRNTGCHMLRRNYLLKYVFEKYIKQKIEEKEQRRRWHKQLPYDLQETTGTGN